MKRSLFAVVGLMVGSPAFAEAPAAAPFGGEVGEVQLMLRSEPQRGMVLESATFEMPGRPVLASLEGDQIKEGTDLTVLRGEFIAGKTKVKATFVYRAKSLFSSDEDSTYKVVSTFDLNVKPHTRTVVKTIGFEQGTFAQQAHQKLRVRLDVKRSALDAVTAEPSAPQLAKL